jgi:hypothetical protein
VAAERPDVPIWRHSSFCNGGTCLEIAVQGGVIAVRDSRNPEGPVLRFSAERWQEFVGGIKSGQLA